MFLISMFFQFQYSEISLILLNMNTIITIVNKTKNKIDFLNIR